MTNSIFNIKNEIFLNKGREKNILFKHPWIFSGALQRFKGNPVNGEPVFIKSFNNELLGIGSFSSRSQISVRMWTFGEDAFSHTFFCEKINNAYEIRSNLINGNTNAFRVVYGEADGIPGFILDKYADYYVCQFLSSGSEYFKDQIVKAIVEIFNPKCVYERSDSDVRKKEGLEPIKGVLFGEAPKGYIEIVENDINYYVDIINGHKTGFYLDQRENRCELLKYVNGKSVLNCFSYTGGFGIYALKGGAKSVVNVESNDGCNQLAKKNVELNSLDLKNISFESEDVFTLLRKYRDSEKQFDVIVLDPPKFAESVSQVNKASRAYKDVNLLAMKLLKKNGILFTFSCSGHIEKELFNKIINGAAFDSGREVRIIKSIYQGVDHPILSTFPEAEYLKGLICVVS